MLEAPSTLLQLRLNISKLTIGDNSNSIRPIPNRSMSAASLINKTRLPP